MMNSDLFQEYLEQLAERYTAEELVFELDLDVWDIIEAFRDKLEDKPVDLDRYRHE